MSHLFLNCKILNNNKAMVSQTGSSAYIIHAFLVSSVTCETLNGNIMHTWSRSCDPVNLCLIFTYRGDFKLSFPNKNIKIFIL